MFFGAIAWKTSVSEAAPNTVAPLGGGGGFGARLAPAPASGSAAIAAASATATNGPVHRSMRLTSSPSSLDHHRR